jgi:hypothetical protein
MSRHKDLQRVLHYYRQVTGKKDVDMTEVAQFAVDKLGMKLPKPVDPMERLSRELSRAAREETRLDEKTGRPYRANHMFIDGKGQHLWLDVDDEAPRHKMHGALQLRREQMVGDAMQLSNDADHWNETHPTEEPIQLVMNFENDVAERRAMSELDKEAAE